jgi:Tfp pilus assembly protein PilF
MTARLQSELPSDLHTKLARGEISLASVFRLDQETLYEIAGLGYRLLNSGNLTEAKQIYAGLVAADPFDSVFHCHLAAVHHRLGELDDAFREYSEALKFNWANVDALVGRGELQITQQRFIEGLRDLRQGIELDPSAIRSSTIRARALLHALEEAKS